MYYNANAVKWVLMEIRGIQGYFSDLRIYKHTIPKNFYHWELSEDDDGYLCRYKPNIIVNFYGTFITTKEMPIDEPGLQEGFVNSLDDWGFMDSDEMTLDEVIKMEEI